MLLICGCARNTASSASASLPTAGRVSTARNRRLSGRSVARLGVIKQQKCGGFARSRFFVHIAAAQTQRETDVLKFNFPAPILVIAIGYGQTVLGQFGGKPLGEFLGSVDIRLARRFFE